jgi:hypothetical protein
VVSIWAVHDGNVGLDGVDGDGADGGYLVRKVLEESRIEWAQKGLDGALVDEGGGESTECNATMGLGENNPFFSRRSRAACHNWPIAMPHLRKAG